MECVVPVNVHVPVIEAICFEIPGGVGRGFSKANNVNKMYKAELEFPEGWGCGLLRNNPFHGGGIDDLLNFTIL